MISDWIPDYLLNTWPDINIRQSNRGDIVYPALDVEKAGYPGNRVSNRILNLHQVGYWISGPLPVSSKERKLYMYVYYIRGIYCPIRSFFFPKFAAGGAKAKFLEFMTQKDAFLRPFPPFFM